MASGVVGGHDVKGSVDALLTTSKSKLMETHIFS